MGFRRDLLVTIDRLEKPHGLALKNALEEYYHKEVHRGRLYPDLDTLVHKEFVKKEQMDRRTNQYALTDRGKRELEARREWEDRYVNAVLKIPAEN